MVALKKDRTFQSELEDPHFPCGFCYRSAAGFFASFLVETHKWTSTAASESSLESEP